MRFPPALRHRRYRLLWIGLIISVTGTRMQAAAVLWHIHEINEAPIALGGVGMARILPILLFSSEHLFRSSAGALGAFWHLPG